MSQEGVPVQVHCAPVQHDSLPMELAGSLEGGAPFLPLHLIRLVPSCCSAELGYHSCIASH